MNPLTIALVALRGLGLAMSISGRTKEADQLFQLSDFVAAGVATDEHMRQVADLLNERTATSVDLSEVLSSIEAERNRLHSDGPTP